MKTILIKLYILAAILLLQNTVSAQLTNCPENIDFEKGDYSNWQFFTGACCPISTGTIGQLNDRHFLVTGGTDPYGGFPRKAPGGGAFSMKLGNSQSGAAAERARYYVRVPVSSTSSFSILYSYAVVFEDPNHSPSQQPRFEVTVFDSITKAPLPCNQFTFIASANIPGFERSTVDTNVYYKDWTTSTIDLTAFAGTTVGIDFSTGDCALGAHFGYGYFDVQCGTYQTQKIYCSDLPTISLVGPPGFKDYEWRDSATFAPVGTGEVLTIPTPSVTKSYAIIVNPYLGFGCPDTLYTRFEIDDMLLTKTSDTVMCETDDIELYISSNSTAKPYTYQWSSTGPLSCTNCANPVIKPTSKTTYYVTLTDSTGCKKTDSIIVDVSKEAFADIVIPKDTICMFEHVEIENIAPNQSTAYHDWTIINNEGDILSGQGFNKINAYWTVQGLNQIKLSVLNGACKATDSASLYTRYSPRASFDIPDAGCRGEAIKMTVLEQDDAKYTWNIDEQFIFDTVAKPLYYLKWDSLGKKNISLNVSNENDCNHELTASITIYDYPPAAINVEDLSSICYGKEFKLSTPEGLRYRYDWSPPQFFRSNNRNEVTSVAEKTGYLHLSVVNEWGCESVDSVFISAAPCCEIFMPDAFTPNGDGNNDTYSSPDFSKHRLLNFTIAHRRGNIVFQTSNPNDTWNGTYKGQKLDVGTYSYFVNYICEGEEKLKKGTFTLLR